MTDGGVTDGGVTIDGVTLAWGIAGTGRIARDVGRVLAAEATVVAVGSRDAARAQALASELGAGAAHGSYDALVADPAVQAVYVATPHTGHAEVVAAALRAGKAVLCEKPMTAQLAETEALVALAAETGCFLMEAVWMRFNPLVQQLARLVDEGALGEVRSLRASLGFAAAYDPAGRLWDSALGGGALLDIGLYVVDLARLLLGDPTDVVARGSLAPTGVDAECTLALSWPSGARGLLDCSLTTDLPGTAVVVGSRGWASIGPSFHAPTLLRVSTGSDLVEYENPSRQAGFVGEVREVARCVAARRAQSDVMPLAESLATARVLQDARAQLGS